MRRASRSTGLWACQGLRVHQAQQVQPVQQVRRVRRVPQVPSVRQVPQVVRDHKVNLDFKGPWGRRGCRDLKE